MTNPKEQKPEVRESRQILSDYAQKCSTIDEGNLYFAATQLEQAFDAAQKRITELEGALEKNKKVWDYYCEFETFDGVNSDADVLETAIEATNQALKGKGVRE